MMILQNVSALKGKNVHLPNYRENQVNGNCTRTKKLKLQYKVATKLLFRQVQFASQTVQFILQDCFLLHFSFALFSVTLPCLNFPPSLQPTPPPPSHHFLTPVPKAFILKVSWWVCLNLESYLFILMPVSNYMYVCMYANGRRSVLVRYGHVVLVTCKTFQSMKYVVVF